MIYLDNNATTVVDPNVYIQYCEILKKCYGNASSAYPLGIISRNIIETARMQVAKLINADIIGGDKIIFTSCASESNNSVLASVIGLDTQNIHIIISSVEHPSIEQVAIHYEQYGVKVTRINVNHDGRLNEDELLENITPNTKLVSIMMVNSETGVINDIKKIVQIVRARNPAILIHTDAVQAVGKMPIDVKELDVDFLSLSGHKFHSPKGIGALYVKKGVQFTPFIYGGHQEHGLRAGTENPANAAAIGLASSLANDSLKNGLVNQILEVRDYLEEQLTINFPDSIIFGKNVPRVCNTTNIGFKKKNGALLVLKLANKGIFVSSGTACNTQSQEPSKVLSAMNVPTDYISSIRISLSKNTTKDEIDSFIAILRKII